MSFNDPKRIFYRLLEEMTPQKQTETLSDTLEAIEKIIIKKKSDRSKKTW
jgi:hypothetical protein